RSYRYYKVYTNQDQIRSLNMHNACTIPEIMERQSERSMTGCSWRVRQQVRPIDHHFMLLAMLIAALAIVCGLSQAHAQTCAGPLDFGAVESLSGKDTDYPHLKSLISSQGVSFLLCP